MHCTHALISLTKSLTNSLSDFSLNILKILPINDFPGWSFRPPQTPQEVDSFLLFFPKIFLNLTKTGEWNSPLQQWCTRVFVVKFILIPKLQGILVPWSMGSLRSITPYNGREDLEQVKQERGTQLCINRKVLPIAKINYAQFVTRKTKSSTYWQ